MLFAIYKGQTLHIVIESDPGKSPPALHAEILRVMNNADSCVAVNSEEDLAVLRANSATTAAIAAGYEFRGLRFSLSLHHQINLTQLYMTRNTPLAGLPVTLANIDDTAWITLTKPEDIEEMAMAMGAAKRAALDAGNAAKRAVKD